MRVYLCTYLRKAKENIKFSNLIISIVVLVKGINVEIMGRHLTDQHILEEQ